MWGSQVREKKQANVLQTKESLQLEYETYENNYKGKEHSTSSLNLQDIIILIYENRY